MDRAAGRVRGVGDPAHRVPALARQVEAEGAFRVGREGDPLIDEPADRIPAVLRDEPGGVLVDQAAAGDLRVVDVELHAVVVPEDADDPALRPRGGGLLEPALREHDDPVAVGELERDGEAGEPGAHDDHRKGVRVDEGGDDGRALGAGGVGAGHAGILCRAADAAGREGRRARPGRRPPAIGPAHGRGRPASTIGR